MLGMNFVDYTFVAAGGPDVLLSDVRIGCYSLTVAVRSAQTSATEQPWFLSVVYGPQDDVEKELFMEELTAIRDDCEGPWAVIGDFNLILDESDKSNARMNRRNMSRSLPATGGRAATARHSYAWQEIHVEQREAVPYTGSPGPCPRVHGLGGKVP
jgi:hypothetical protein